MNNGVRIKRAKTQRQNPRSITRGANADADEFAFRRVTKDYYLWVSCVTYRFISADRRQLCTTHDGGKDSKQHSLKQQEDQEHRSRCRRVICTICANIREVENGFNKDCLFELYIYTQRLHSNILESRSSGNSQNQLWMISGQWFCNGRFF